MILFLILSVFIGLDVHVDSFLEEYLEPRQYLEKALAVLESQNKDGSWSDVEYDSPQRGSWPASKHISYFRILASTYYVTGEIRYLEAARKALAYWDERKPLSLNWWWNEIGIPRNLGPAAILIRKDLSQTDIDKVCRVLEKATLRATGQNKIWLAENVMMKAFLQKDEPLFLSARDAIVSEVVVRKIGEGLHSDWSFHQHGPQLQWGNYGLSYGDIMSWLVKLFSETSFAMSEEQVNIIKNYLVKGLSTPVWNGYFDMNACGRQVFKETQRSKAKTVLSALSRLGLEPSEKIGPSYYPCSDYAVYRASNWYASLRMQSNRTKGIECTNKENMPGYFSSDGALLIRRDGDEYYDVAACWNWRHIPGVSCYDNGKELYGWKSQPHYNITGNVNGYVNGNHMICHMELVRDSLFAQKTWVFFDKGIVCLGAGISRKGPDRVLTGVEQCRIKGPVRKNSKWIHHNGITYIPLYGTSFKQAAQEHRGDWHRIAPMYSREEVKMNLLDLYIDHGCAPDSASYAYVVIADGSAPSDAYLFVKKNIKIVSNTEKSQIVSVYGENFVGL